MNILEQFEQSQLETLTEGKVIPEFGAGDTVRVNVRIIEGTTERIQAYEGICIARRNRGLNSSFTVRKISHGEGVERVFPLHSPRVESIEVVRRGVVRRAKLYYMRNLSGKAARIREKRDFLNEKKGGAEKTAKKEAKAPVAAKEEAPKEAKPAAKKEAKAKK